MSCTVGASALTRLISVRSSASGRRSSTAATSAAPSAAASAARDPAGSLRGHEIEARGGAPRFGRFRRDAMGIDCPRNRAVWGRLYALQPYERVKAACIAVAGQRAADPSGVLLRAFQPQLPHQRAPLLGFRLDVALDPFDRGRCRAGSGRYCMIFCCISGVGHDALHLAVELGHDLARRVVAGEDAHATTPPRGPAYRPPPRAAERPASVGKARRRGDGKRAQLAVLDQRQRSARPRRPTRRRDRRRRRRSIADCCDTARGPCRSRISASAAPRSGAAPRRCPDEL